FGTSRWAARRSGYINLAIGRKGHDRLWHKADIGLLSEARPLADNFGAQIDPCYDRPFRGPYANPWNEAAHVHRWVWRGGGVAGKAHCSGSDEAPTNCLSGRGVAESERPNGQRPSAKLAGTRLSRRPRIRHRVSVCGRRCVNTSEAGRRVGSSETGR